MKHNLAVNTQRTPGVAAGFRSARRVYDFRKKVSSERCCRLHLRYSLVAGLDYSRFQSSEFGFDSFRNNAVPNCFSHRPRARCGVVQRAGTQTVFEPINGPPYGHGSLAARLGPTQCHGNSRSEDGDRRGRRCYSTLVRLTHSAPPHCLQPLGSFLLDLRGRFRLEHHAHLGATAWWLK